MRGRLIQKFVVDIARLDVVATAATVGGGYDVGFNEPIPVEDGTQLGAASKKYQDVDILNCQLDRKLDWGERVPTRDGEEIHADIIIGLHWPDLERLDLLDSNKIPKFNRGDKIVEIRNKKGALETRFDDPPGMFITDLGRAGYGLDCFGTPRTNLLYLFCAYDKTNHLDGDIGD